MNDQVGYYIVSDISANNSVTSKMSENNVLINEPAWNNNTVTSNNQTVKTEPNDYEAITLENITIKTEITPANEPKLKYEFDNPVILSTEKVIIKEELNIDEVLYDESIRNTQNWGDVNDPLAVSPTKINQKLKCEICGGSFPQSRQLNNHLFIIHRPLTVTGSGAYCHKCNKWFPETKYPNHNPCFNYMRSIQNGKKMYSCEICDQDYTAVSLLKAHLVESHRPFIVQDTLNLPEAILKQIICKICGAVFPANKLLIHHLTVMHRPYTITGEGAFCTRCQIWFAEDKFKDHSPCVTPVQGVFPVFSCNICNTEFKMLHLLKTHMHVIHRPLSLEYLADAFCDACNRWFKEDNYTMHKCFRRSNIKTRNKYAYAFKCTICSKEFENDADIKKHLFNVHRPVIAFDCGDTVFCDFCKKCFNEDKFEMHIPCHSVDSKCVFCLITMPSKDHYLLHDLTWTKWRSYQCNLCNLNTQDMRLANLNQHMIYHGKKSIFRCVKCKFDFVSTENAEAHIECFHLGCRCVMDPCVCSTYNYDYYYEFVKQRNISDFRGNNKNLLENEIILIREEQYNSIESDIDVGHVKKEVNYNHFQPAGITNNVSMPSTSTSTSASTILEDFSIPPGISKIVDDSKCRVNYRLQEVTPKTEDVLLIESPAEKRRRLHGKSEKRRNQRRETRLKKEQKQKSTNMNIRKQSIIEPSFDFVNIEAPPVIPTLFIPEVEKVSKQKPNKNYHKTGDNERHEIFLARRRVYMQNYRRLKRQQPNTEEENEEEAAEKRARTNERIRIARQKREALMSKEELLQRRAVKAEKVRLRRQMQREQLSEEELSQIRAIEAERKRLKRRQLSKEQMQKHTNIQNQLSEDEILIKSEKTDDDSSCLTNDEDQILEQLRNEQLKELNNY